jgi:hypothetical protein
MAKTFVERLVAINRSQTEQWLSIIPGLAGSSWRRNVVDEA